MSRDLSRPAAAGLAAAGLLAVGAVAALAIRTPPPAEAPGAIPASWTPRPVTATPFPSLEPSFNPAVPLTVTEVAAGRPVRLEGSGTRQIAWHVPDDSMVVALLDCSRCSGRTRVVAGDRSDAAYDGPAATVTTLFNAGTPRDGLARVEAQGSWRVTLSSTRDLAPVAEASGVGSGVVALRSGTGIEVVSPGASGQVRVYAADRSQLFATALAREPLRLDTGRTVIVAVETDGPWRVRLLP